MDIEERQGFENQNRNLLFVLSRKPAHDLVLKKKYRVGLQKKNILKGSSYRTPQNGYLFSTKERKLLD